MSSRNRDATSSATRGWRMRYDDKFPRRPFLAKLYKIVIVAPTVWPTIRIGKGGYQVSEQVDAGAPDGSVRHSHDGAILRITLDRPSRRNSLNHKMTDGLVGILTAAATDDTLRAISIEGAGGDFCSGADWVATNDSGQRPRTGDLVRRIPHTANRVIELLTTIHLPVVGRVRGWAVGLGCNIALAADFTVADTEALFWEPFLSRGFTPDSGATWLLPRLVGVARARRMLLLGEKVTGSDAAEWGLIHAAVDAAELDATADELLARLASGPTVAIGLAKQALHYGQHATLNQSLNSPISNSPAGRRISRRAWPGSGSVAYPTSRAGRKETHGGTVCRRLRHHHLRRLRPHGDHHVESPGGAQCAVPAHDHRVAGRL